MDEPRKMYEAEQPDDDLASLLRAVIDRLRRIETILAEAPKKTGCEVGEAINGAAGSGRRGRN